jgi:thiol-disulfide isomerase/thioredoxin
MANEGAAPARPARWRLLARGLAEGAVIAGAFWLAYWGYSDRASMPPAATILGVTALCVALTGLSRALTGGIIGALVGTVLAGVIAWEVAGRRAPPPAFSAGPEPKFVGQPARINGPTLDGGKFDIAGHKGKVVLVDFWATWCVPCLQEMPELVRLYHRYRGEGLEVVGVSHDRAPEPLHRYVRENNIPWPQIFHPEPEKRGGRNPNAVAYEVETIPHNLVVDRQGTIVAEGVRGEALRRAVERALRQGGPTEEGSSGALFGLFLALGWVAGAALEWSLRQPSSPELKN